MPDEKLHMYTAMYYQAEITVFRSTKPRLTECTPPEYSILCSTVKILHFDPFYGTLHLFIGHTVSTLSQHIIMFSEQQSLLKEIDSNEHYSTFS